MPPSLSLSNLCQIIAWATRHQREITDWLADHPNLHTEYERIAHELGEISTQIQALANR